MRKFGILIAVLAIGFVGCKNVEKKDAIVDENLMPMESPVVDSHTSETSLDWAGVYEGTMPCADCEGIQVLIELKEDNTFVASYTYLGKPEEFEVDESGSFSWDESGSKVTLNPSQGEVSMYKVGENHLTLLDENAEVNTGELAEFYVLQKKID